MIQAVIFDLDETLIDNSDHHITASCEVFKPFQKKGAEITEENPEYMGMRVSDVIRDIMQKLEIPEDQFENLYNKRQHIFVDLVKKSCKPMPGVEYITRLVSELRLKKALASSGMKEYIDLCLEKLHLTDYFDSVVSGEDLHYGKPHPETFLVAAKKLGVEPENCLVIEDAEHGIEAAKAAGMKCIGVHYPHTDPKLMQDLSQADIQVRSLKKITREMLLGT